MTKEGIYEECFRKHLKNYKVKNNTSIHPKEFKIVENHQRTNKYNLFNFVGLKTSRQTILIKVFYPKCRSQRI